MRQIFLDTETTGLYPDQGHRVIEIGAVEAINRRVTGNNYHQYLNPEREIDEGAQAVHGISAEFLQDKPLFASISHEFIEYIQGAELIIHNAPFDVGFLNAELGRLGLKPVDVICDKIIDTLKMAKDARPGQRNNLDALCKYFDIDNSKRTLHGALLDAELLAEVYMALTRGQDSLMIDLDTPQVSHAPIGAVKQRQLKVIMPDEREVAAHEDYLKALDKTLW